MDGSVNISESDDSVNNVEVNEIQLHSVYTPSNASRTRVISFSIGNGEGRKEKVRQKSYEVLKKIYDGGGKVISFTNDVSTEIKELRKIFGKEAIHTIPGVGFYIGDVKLRKTPIEGFGIYNISQVNEDWKIDQYKYILENKKSRKYCFLSDLEYRILGKLKNNEKLTKSEQENRRRIKNKLGKIGIELTVCHIKNQYSSKKARQKPTKKERLIQTIHRNIINILEESPGEIFSYNDLLEIFEVLKIIGATKESIYTALQNIGKTNKSSLLSQIIS